MKKTYDQLINELKKQIGSLPEKLDAYVQKGRDRHNRKQG